MGECIHLANAVKYQKMLATYLTPLEREFVERRLEEKHAALAQACLSPGDETQLAR